MSYERVAILGASDKEQRYSNKALKLLLEYKHHVYPVHPSIKSIDQIAVFKSLEELPCKIDTLAMYLSPKYSASLIEDIIKLRPKRIIFNPGTENPELFERLLEHNIAFEQACVLVLLRTDQF